MLHVLPFSAYWIPSGSSEFVVEALGIGAVTQPGELATSVCRAGTVEVVVPGVGLPTLNHALYVLVELLLPELDEIVRA